MHQEISRYSMCLRELHTLLYEVSLGDVAWFIPVTTCRTMVQAVSTQIDIRSERMNRAGCRRSHGHASEIWPYGWRNAARVEWTYCNFKVARFSLHSA